MSRFKQLVCFFVVTVLSIGLLSGIGYVETRLDEQVELHHLRFEGSVNSAPPLVAVTTLALGSFRGLIADVLWLRANALKDEGNYIETVQLANWITDLQPTYSGMTVYLAWDMAYNISVTCSQREDRWRWVQEGIRLIRDKAIYYNPEDPTLYKDLAWTFMHKMGQIMDDANQYYKNQWAVNMDRIIGRKPDWQAMATVPLGERAFMKQYPEGSPAWIAAAKAGYPTFATLLDAYSDQNGLPPKLAEALKPELAAELSNALRTNWLYANTKVEPSIVIEINEKYGSLDWRTMEAQAIYWAFYGLKKMPGGKNIDCERVISQALAMSFINGRIVELDRKNSAYLIMMPNPNLAQSVLDTYDQAFENNGSQSFISAKLNFYKDAIVLLYSYGMDQEAQDFYRAYQKEERAQQLKADPEAKVRFPPFKDFAQKEWEEDVRTASFLKLNSLLLSRLIEMFKAIGEGRLDDARQLQDQARFIYDDYMKNAKNDPKLEIRTQLAPFDDFIEQAYRVLAQSLAPAEKAQLDSWIQLMLEQEKERMRDAEAQAGK